jgi:hypothetical protein
MVLVRRGGSFRLALPGFSWLDVRQSEASVPASQADE